MKILVAILVTVLSIFMLACGYGTKPTTPAQPGSMPAITQLVPDNTASGGPAFILTVNGSKFSTTATINWNGTAQATTYVTANQLTASIPASDIATAATVSVTVTNPGVSGGAYGGGTLAETSGPMNFTVK